MLTHCYDVVTLPPGTIVYHTTFHTRTERTYRIFLHACLCSLYNCITFQEERHSNRCHISYQGLRVILIHHGIHSHSSNLKLNRSHWLEMSQDMYQRQRVLSATQCYEDLITILNHFKVSNSCPHSRCDLTRNLNKWCFDFGLFHWDIFLLKWKLTPKEAILLIIFFFIILSYWLQWTHIVSTMDFCFLGRNLHILEFLSFIYESIIFESVQVKCLILIRKLKLKSTPRVILRDKWCRQGVSHILINFFNIPLNDVEW